jgi:hypothetical protein
MPNKRVRNGGANQALTLRFRCTRRASTGGAEQRAITGQGIGADIAQFEQERDYPYKQLQFMQSLLQGQPLETQSYSYYEPSGLQSLSGGLNTVKSTLDVLKEIFN